MDSFDQFRVGDRVRARSGQVVPAGTPGIIRQVFVSAPGFYFIQFAGFAQHHLMHARNLERVTDEPDAGP